MDKRLDHVINHDPYTMFFYHARGSKQENHNNYLISNIRSYSIQSNARCVCVGVGERERERERERDYFVNEAKPRLVLAK